MLLFLANPTIPPTLEYPLIGILFTALFKIESLIYPAIPPEYLSVANIAFELSPLFSTLLIVDLVAYPTIPPTWVIPSTLALLLQLFIFVLKAVPTIPPVPVCPFILLLSLEQFFIVEIFVSLTWPAIPPIYPYIIPDFFASSNNISFSC